MNQFSKFDFGSKGFLVYQEYVGLSLMLGKKPLRKSEVGDCVKREDLRFGEKAISLESDILDFISSEDDLLTAESIKNACLKLGLSLSDEDIVDMFQIYEGEDVILHKQ